MMQGDQRDSHRHSALCRDGADCPYNRSQGLRSFLSTCRAWAQVAEHATQWEFARDINAVAYDCELLLEQYENGIEALP